MKYLLTIKNNNSNNNIKMESLILDTSWGSNTIFDVGIEEEFNLNIFQRKMETAKVSNFFTDNYLRDHLYLIKGEYYDGKTIFRSLVLYPHARASNIVFQLWRRQVGGPLFTKLYKVGIDLDLDLSDRDPPVFNFERLSGYSKGFLFLSRMMFGVFDFALRGQRCRFSFLAMF